MAIRLEHIRINRGGPLRGDFELECGDLNLIYGCNETGKTYLVEALIRVLFSKGKKSQVAWDLREWDLKGRVEVSGLEAEPVAFTTTGRKLEEYWEEGSGLPPDLARLLVVKGGDTVLEAGAADGVGERQLREYLSGEGMLDGIAQRIPPTIRDAGVDGRQIQGASRGEVKAREQLRQDRARIDGLLSEVEERYASGKAHALRWEMAQLEGDRAGFEAARQHRAAALCEELEEQRRQQQALPDQQELAELSEQLAVCETRAADVRAKTTTLAELDETGDDFRWAERALETYREITGGEGVSGTRPALLVGALAFMAAAVGSGLVGWKNPMLICAVVSVGLVGMYYWAIGRTLARAGEGRELERLKEEFERRFGEDLSGRATLEAHRDRLRENHIQATSLRKELEQARTKLRQLEAQIRAELERYTDTKPEPGAWRHAVGALRKAVEDHEEKVRRLEKELDALGVAEQEQRPDEHPGVEWDRGRFEELVAKLEGKEEELEDATGELAQLRTRTLQELGRQDGDWEELIEALRDRRGQVADEYRRITAEILGKIQVRTVIEGLRERENERIAAGLRSEAVSEPLWALTGRYSAVRQDEEGQLVLLDEHDECPLSMASTGTREQVFLALRIGFASLLMQGETGFLILDDAFQHSDWQRRGNCVRVLLDLIAAGWQVFYFTMDDHIRDLFAEAGRTLEDRYKMVDLA